MEHSINLSRLMRISWAIQRSRRWTRSRSLVGAWAIVQNEELVVQSMALRLNRNKPLSERALNQITIFNQ